MTNTPAPSDGLDDKMLERCPFCNEADAFVERADFSSCYVVCNNCSARGPTSCDETDADANASEEGEAEPGEMPARRLWNTRTTARLRDDGFPELVERLRVRAGAPVIDLRDDGGVRERVEDLHHPIVGLLRGKLDLSQELIDDLVFSGNLDAIAAAIVEEAASLSALPEQGGEMAEEPDSHSFLAKWERIIKEMGRSPDDAADRGEG